MSLRPYLVLTTLIGIASTLGLSACGGRQVPSEYHWDQSPQALVASYGTAGGMVPALMQFRESVYGSPFVRLMGDGTLYYGTPNKVFVRKLSKVEIQDLMAKLRPDLFSDYKESYNAGMATDMPTTTIRINVEEWGDYQVGIYGLSQAGSAEQSAALPVSLLEATTALRQAGSRAGDPWFWAEDEECGESEADGTHYAVVNPARRRQAPTSSMT